MTFQYNEVEPCKINVHYVADADVVEEKRQEAIENFRNVKISGFRKSKAPDSAIKIKLKKEIEECMTREIVAHAYDEVLFETKMKSIGYPQVSNVMLDGSYFHCDLFFLKKPDFELSQYKDFDIPMPHQPFSPEEIVHKMLQELRVKYGDVVPYSEDDFVQEGDKLTMDVECSVNDDKIEELSKSGVVYDVGSNWLPDFDINLYGMAGGEERAFNLSLDDTCIKSFKTELGLNLPDDAKEISCKVTLHMGIKNVPCALDDDFATKMNLKSYDELRQNVQGIATRKHQENEKRLISQQVINKLVDAHDIEVPAWLVLLESQQLAAQGGFKWSDVSDENKLEYNKFAEKNVKLSLILDSVREVEPECCFSDAEIIKMVESNLSQAGQDGKKFIEENQKNGRLVGMIAAWKDQSTLEWLMNKNNIVE